MNSLFFEEISEQEVINLCSSLRSGTATGFDDVPMSLIKETITLIRLRPHEDDCKRKR